MPPSQSPAQLEASVTREQLADLLCRAECVYMNTRIGSNGYFWVDISFAHPDLARLEPEQELKFEPAEER